MRPRLIIALVLLIAIAGYAAWWFSPTQVVTRKTHQLLETISLEAGSGLAPRQMRSMTLEKLLAKQVQLAVATEEDLDGKHSRSDLLSMYSALCNSTKVSEFKVVTIDTLDASAGRAEVKLLISAHVEMTGDGKPFDGNYPTRLVWQKSADDGWQLSEVRVDKP